MSDEDKQYHLHELTRIADMMESYSDDDSAEGVRFMKELKKDYRYHMKAAGLKLFVKP